MMQKDELESLLWRFQNDLCTEDERQQVEQWYESLQIEESNAFTVAELQGIGRSIRRRMKDVPPFTRQVNQKKIFYWTGSGVVVALAIFFYLFVFLEPKVDHLQGELLASFIEHKNQLSNEITIRLPDGSLVTLSPGASLKYPTFFSLVQRDVFLSGVGFFSVARDSARPFFVHSAQLTVRVLGTSFYVRADKAQESVEVRSGRVEVFKTNNSDNTKTSLISNSVILTPNQQTTYNAGEDHFRTTLVESPRPLSNPGQMPQNKFVFENTNIEDVIQMLGESYGIPIRADTPFVLKCRFTGDLSDSSLSLYEKLEMVCQAIDASYGKEGLEILIRGTGCQ